MDLITPRELALWTGNEPDAVEADPFAAEVMSKVSDLVRFVAGHPEWIYAGDPTLVAPFDVKMLVLKIAKRSYENPGQVVQEGSVGPIGGDRVLDIQAMLFELSETERKILTKYNPDGDVDGGTATLWVQPTTRGDVETRGRTLYVGDDQQINLESTNAAPEWMIPMYSPGDPGDPSRYED